MVIINLNGEKDSNIISKSEYLSGIKNLAVGIKQIRFLNNLVTINWAFSLSNLISVYRYRDIKNPYTIFLEQIITIDIIS